MPFLFSPAMVRLPPFFFSRPAWPSPLLSLLSPSSSMLTLPSPFVETAALPSLLTSMFTPERVTFAVWPFSALMVTVFF